MDDEARRRAVELVQKITNGAISEGERDEAMRELECLVPDPGVGDLIFGLPTTRSQWRSRTTTSHLS
ncbi:MAG: hypothetical protein GY720_01470 [bacterium]|nr:hypothetical protein [bacterium]